MKKTIISFFFIFAFAAYSLYQYFGLSQASTSMSSQPVITTKKNTVKATPNKAIAQKNMYADGTFTGSVADAYYGNIQVQAVIANGQISDVQFLQYPSDRSRSVSINTRAMPILKSEAISSQSANVDIVSGATDSSQAFVQSLSSALAQALN
jgi:uncharacterized protein with FMN-binding domain